MAHLNLSLVGDVNSNPLLTKKPTQMKVCVVRRGKRTSANFRPTWSTEEGKRERRGEAEQVKETVCVSVRVHTEV